MIIRRYSELIQLDSFIERFNYLKLGGTVGKDTFGFDRYLNQILYNSYKWKETRRKIIIRDMGCDLGLDGYEINGKIIVHHMNPIMIEDIVEMNPIIFDEEYLISTSLGTHNAVHYGDESLLITTPTERFKNDTCPWKLD